jgi:formylglycine-generating enzyme required for sulfatase activity
VTEGRSHVVLGLLGAFVLACFAIAAVVLIALRFRGESSHCRDGLQALGPVCCAAGQSLHEGRCVGADFSCPEGMVRVEDPRPGCILENQPIRFGPGSLVIGPMDWEAEGRVAPRDVKIEAFMLDSLEVTVERWQSCIESQGCAKLPMHLEPGQPVTSVSPAVAERFCLFSGGRLPTSDEWLFAAVGSPARRYPWGNTGLVCRRAAFGLVQGPCAEGAVGPTIAGSRPAGATPDGLFDMVGNAAEWTHDGKSFVARGGSFRSEQAADLKSWSSEKATTASPHIGFRCAYDLPKG